MPNELPVETLAGAGFAVAVAGFLLKFFVDHIKRMEKIFENHVEHNTTAQIEVARAIVTMAEDVRALAVELREERHKRV